MNGPHPYGRHAGSMVREARHERLEKPPSTLWCAGCEGFQPRKGGRLRPFFLCAGCRPKAKQ